MIDEPSRRIAILREDVSRKIAAGEVIDRPFSVLRELLDNAVDADAGSIDASIEGGGAARIRVVDDGEGMGREDLALCWRRHATSKIRDEGDIYRVRTLGFRGEALASIAACSRLTVVSRPRPVAGQEAGEANRLLVVGGEELSLEPHQGPSGTSVDVGDLFFNLPARRRFLKSPAAESNLCRQSFLEKALAHPEISFRLSAEGRLRHFFPALEAGSHRDRVVAAFGFDAGLLYSLEAEQGPVRIRAAVGRPELTRRDRKLVQIYVNRRRIFEFGLVQAAEYAYSEYVPGGHHPVAFLFLEVDPAEVDFNIHPAKREVRFRDLPSVRRLVSGTLREFLRAFDLKARPGAAGQPGPSGQPGAEGGGTARTYAHPELPMGSGGEAWGSRPMPPGAGREGLAEEPLWGSRPLLPAAASAGSAAASRERAAARPPAAPGGLRYLGQLFRLFLLVQRGDRLYVVDQHAAHERILFERMKARPPVAQELLMPIRVEGARAGAEAPEAGRPGAGAGPPEAGPPEKGRPGAASPGAGLLERRGELERQLGIRLQPTEDGAVEIVAMPEELLALEEEELVEAILWERGSVEELQARVLSLAACRLAVKEGEELDAGAAESLVRGVFALDNARCPHGRPIWTELSREDLERAVGRE